MKRAASPGLCDSYSDGDERPAKVPRRESSSTVPGSLRGQQERIKPQPPPSPFSPDFDSRVSCENCFAVVM